jgi:hypothetical protein
MNIDMNDKEALMKEIERLYARIKVLSKALRKLVM